MDRQWVAHGKVTGPLRRAAQAADRIKDAADAREMTAGEVADACGEIVDALAEATPPFGRHAESDKSALTRLRERVDQWEDWHDCSHIPDGDTFQIAAYANWLRVPPSWVRANCEPRDIRVWAQHAEVKAAKQQREIQRQKEQ